MSISNRVSTGMPGLDGAIDMLRLGDNVVWQVQSIDDFSLVVDPYIQQAKKDGRNLIYFQFGNHKQLIKEDEASVIYKLDTSEGFELFTEKIYKIIKEEGEKAFYVFDCLSDLLDSWCSDMMVANFFRISCPFLYQLDTIAYFALLRGSHSHDTIARIRETTQVLLDVYKIEEKLYIHPLKAWERYSPTMFFPHLINGDVAISITSSMDAATLFSRAGRSAQDGDYWTRLLEKARALLDSSGTTETSGTAEISGGNKAQEDMKNHLIGLLISREERITGLCLKYFSLSDILDITDREIGTGFIGGKSVGMLLARKILEKEAKNNECLASIMENNWEPHDSFYIGSDIFYTYIVYNGYWAERIKQKTSEGYFSAAKELHEKLLRGKFPEKIRELFIQMLEYFGQSPIIVRSSSLREDNFGNAFAGKYESVFCANQGTPDERCRAFEDALRIVYASTMNEDALYYRRHRGLEKLDEQMAVLVQRVSGNHYGNYFFPHVAGVGNSVNLYVWEKNMDPDAGMLRLVFGLGTRAVDRVSADYARLVSLDKPDRLAPLNYGDEKKFSQHKADILDLQKNSLDEKLLEELLEEDIKTDKNIFFSTDTGEINRLRDLGIYSGQRAFIADFKHLLGKTEFPNLARTILKTLSKAYNYPVDIEFTLNFTPEGDYKFNLLQCRPLQTKGLGKALEIPNPKTEDILLSTSGGFMGGNVRLPIEYAVFIKPKEYLDLPEKNKYQVARLVGKMNNVLKGSSVLLLGPGRWGTTTPSLGIPVHFSELCNMTAICEISCPKAGIMPELSFGSHFFQDMVESDIFYAAIYEGEPNVVFNEDCILDSENLAGKILGIQSPFNSVIHISKIGGLILHSNISDQKLLIYRNST